MFSKVSKYHAIIIGLGFTWQWIEPAIFRTLSDHLYTTEPIGKPRMNPHYKYPSQSANPRWILITLPRQSANLGWIRFTLPSQLTKLGWIRITLSSQSAKLGWIRITLSSPSAKLGWIHITLSNQTTNLGWIRYTPSRYRNRLRSTELWWVHTEQKRELSRGLGLWCLTPLSTIFQLYRGSNFIAGENWIRSTRRKPPTCRKSLSCAYKNRHFNKSVTKARPIMYLAN